MKNRNEMNDWIDGRGLVDSSENFDVEVIGKLEDTKYTAGKIIGKDLAALQEIDLEQFERAGIEELVIGKKGEVTYTYLGYPIELTFAEGLILIDNSPNEEEIHSMILEKLGCGKKELPKRGNAGIHIPANIAVGLGLENREYALRSTRFNNEDATETGFFLTLEDDLGLAEKKSLTSLLNGDIEPKVNHIEVPRIFIKLYQILKDMSGNK